jgi:hypothetical protein
MTYMPKMTEMPVVDVFLTMDYVSLQSVGKLALKAAEWPIMPRKWKKSRETQLFRVQMTKQHLDRPLAWEISLF